MEREAIEKSQIEQIEQSINKLAESMEKFVARIDKVIEIEAKKLIDTLKEKCNTYGEVQEKLYLLKKNISFEQEEKRFVFKEIFDAANTILNEEVAEIKLVDNSAKNIKKSGSLTHE